MHRHACILLATILVTGCSPEQEFIETPAPALPDHLSVAFIGNSLTRHGPKPPVGWFGDYGMAASSIDTDYAHKTAQKLGIPYSAIYVRNLYPFETNSVAAKRLTESLKETFLRSDKIVIQLSENVKWYNPLNVYNFNYDYSTLIESIPPGKPFFCISSYWQSNIRDYVIKQACESNGGHYVYVGDIYDSTKNTERNEAAFADKGINKHPHDYGMNAIADRLVEAMAD